MADGSVASFASTQLFWLILAAALLGVGVIALLVWLTLKSRDTSPRPRSIGLAEQRALERDISTLMTDLSEMARQVGQQLDARASRLEQLIRKADERIEQLHTATTTVPPPAPAPAAIETDPADDDPRHVEVYRLCDEGFDPSTIAQRLNRPAGEVELIIALRPRRVAPTHVTSR